MCKVKYVPIPQGWYINEYLESVKYSFSYSSLICLCDKHLVTVLPHYSSSSWQAVRLEGASPQVARYMVVVSTNGRQDTEECAVLGVDFESSDRWGGNTKTGGAQVMTSLGVI